MAPAIQVTFDDEDDRYHRQSLISWWDQERLADAKVLVVGAGALGNELLKNLALLGVGTIVVVDMDDVENSNLSRCVLFRERDEGRPKVIAAAEALAELNPNVDIVPVVGDIRAAIGLGAYAEFDVVLGGLDNREARLHVNQRCWKAATPWIDGAIEGLMGVVRVFIPPASACYECTLSDRELDILAARRTCSLLTRTDMLAGKTPTTATSASIVAAMQVQEAVKLLHSDRIEPALAGKGVVYNGLTHDSYIVGYRRDEECLSHDTYDLTTASSLADSMTLAEVMDAAGPDATAIDLESEMVLSMTCANCQLTVEVASVFDTLTVDDASCPQCGQERQPELAHAIARGDELASRTIGSLGLPPLDIVTVRTDGGRKHFMVGGDTRRRLQSLARLEAL